MSYTVVQTAEPGKHLDGRERDKDLPDGVEVKLLKQVGANAGHRKVGDHFIEFFYDSPAAERAHLAQRQGL